MSDARTAGVEAVVLSGGVDFATVTSMVAPELSSSVRTRRRS